jgi:magnesium-transporting ATPase (P-type)
VTLERLNKGERIAGISAILLFVFMFFHWFGVKAVNTSNLLFDVRAGGPGKSAWEALEYIPIVLLIAIIAALAVAALRFTNIVHRPFIQINALVAMLGFVSVLLILFRIVDPPIFNVERTVTFEATIRLPIFLALLAAAGIAVGGYQAMREEGFSLAHLRAGRDRDMRGELPPSS